MDAIKKALIPHSCPDGGIGRRNRLKICRPQGLRVQVPFRVPFSSQLTVPGKTALSTLKIHDFLSKCLVCLFFFCRAKNGTVHYGAGCLHCVQALRRCAPGQVPFRVPFSSQLTVPGKTALSTLKIHDFLSKMPCLPFLFFAGQKTALFTMGAGCLHCVQALRRCAPGQAPDHSPPLPCFAQSVN